MAKNKYSKRLPKLQMGGLGQLQQIQAQLGNTMGDALINKAGRTNAAANIGGNVFKGGMSGTGALGAGLGLITGIMDYNKAKQEKEDYDNQVQWGKSMQEMSNYQQTLRNNQVNIPTFPNGGFTGKPEYKTKEQLLAESKYTNASQFYKENPLNKAETYDKLIGNPNLRNEMYNLVKGYTGSPNDSTALFTSGINKYTLPYEELNEPVYESSQGLRNALNPNSKPIDFEVLKTKLGVKADGGDLQNSQESSVQPYTINYNGASHVNGGIPVNGTTGNPVSITGEQADAEVEGQHMSQVPKEGEIAVRFKNSSTPYIFSDKLGYAKEAKKIQNKYSKRPNDKISQDAMYGELEGLMNQQEEYRSKMIDKYATKIKELGGMLSEEDVDQDNLEEMKKGGWIQKAINPKHKGYCTPMTKPTCTGHRRALALRFKHGDLHKEDGGDLPAYANGDFLTEDQYLRGYDTPAPLMPKSVAIPSLGTKIDPTKLNVAYNTREVTESPYTGQVSPLGAVANMAGNAILMATNKKAPGITAPYINAQNVDLSAAREAIKANSIYSRANRLAALRNAGLSQGQYASAIGSVDSDLNRGTNEGLLQSYLGEQQANVGYKQQANLVNTQNAMQAQQYNAAIQDRYNKEQQEYLANLLATPAQYLSESQKAQRDALLIQTQSPNVKVTQKNRGSKAANLLLGPQSVGFNYNG